MNLPREWQPIETTPEQPMRVLLYFPQEAYLNFVGADYSIRVAYWSGSHWQQQGTNHDCFEPWEVETGNVPTHWMPLPEPPNSLDNTL